ncbi:hypothetical protein N431DRAFT_468950 [Stipitochalara longipes BDJ]|nr:hypothetical protein N431DRAFT_468950 [Stipitochalara longipes BDJ]
MLQDDGAVRGARIACLPCRKSKRRCDKKVPSCNLCIQKDIECSYSARREAVQASPSSTRDVSSLERSSQSWAHAIYFLTPHVFQQTRLELPRANLKVPAEVSSLIGDIPSIRGIAAIFFEEIHRWLTIISKESFFVHLLSPLAERQTELSLLTLCMKLCCASRSDGDSQTILYNTAKRFYHEVEAAGFLSIPVLQSGILIAFYELGQAIYPAAYLTVGACARYGLMLGLDRYLLALEGDSDGPRSWIEVEEKRRVWWAVLIFDRYLNLSNPLRPLSTEDPTFDSYLPVDDIAWDDSTTKPSDAVRISNGFTLRMGGFARLCQAAYLLSQALRIVATPASTGCATVCTKSRHDEIAQLRRTLIALVHAADSESTIRKLELCAQSALSLSTILLLHENQERIHDASSERYPEQASLESLCFETHTALDRLSSAALSYNETCSQDPASANAAPVFIVHVMYQVACALLRFAQGVPNEETREKIETLKRFLRLMEPRWRFAGKFNLLIYYGKG